MGLFQDTVVWAAPLVEDTTEVDTCLLLEDTADRVHSYLPSMPEVQNCRKGPGHCCKEVGHCCKV